MHIESTAGSGSPLRSGTPRRAMRGPRKHPETRPRTITQNQGPWPGRFVWHDLMTTDVDTAQAFDSEVFGWVPEKKGMGDAGMYRTQELGAVPTCECVPIRTASDRARAQSSPSASPSSPVTPSPKLAPR